MWKKKKMKDYKFENRKEKESELTIMVTNVFLIGKFMGMCLKFAVINRLSWFGFIGCILVFWMMNLVNIGLSCFYIFVYSFFFVFL